MKIQIFIAFVAFFALASGVFVPPRPGKRHHQANKELLDWKECSWGPTYWCQNLTAASSCNAVKHCIQTVWVYQQLPPDTTSVCQTCLDMVKEARDQLESNETQELIKEVFEGSCALIHIKPIVKECDKIADNYIPDLIDTLASQINPQVVCSVAGLCNNEKFQELIRAEEEPLKDTCEGCRTVIGIMENKFNSMSRDEVLQALLGVCGHASSLSDACSNIVITYFTEIYNHLKINFNPRQVCLMSGECSTNFHSHGNVELTEVSHIGYVPVGSQRDDLPCDLCEQLVGHLRDLLVANTTQDEFKRVMEGLCNQTKSFRAECLSLVDEYYSAAYNFLVSELQAKAVCVEAGLCPKNNTQQAPIMPLLPVESVQTLAAQIVAKVNMAMDGASVEVMQPAELSQLPIDLLLPPHTQVLYNSQACVFCEYFLHYIQGEITDVRSEDKIKHIIDKACERLPASVNSSCVEFVNIYEPALVAILAQEIDPSVVCPLIKACPANDLRDVEIFMHQDSSGPNCPLCLFAVTKLEEKVKDKKTKETIKKALDNLCKDLPKSLAPECDDFVDTYTDELVEMMIADLNPQEICVYIKLCTANGPRIPNISVISGDIGSNAIYDNTINGVSTVTKPVEANPQCVICEFVMKEVQDQLKSNQTEDEIKAVVLNICHILPKSVKKECDDFVNQYADTVIQLLIEVTVPNEICRMISLCASKMDLVKEEIFECAICESIVYAMEKILANPKIDHSIDHVVEKACRSLPQKVSTKCTQIMETYGRTIYNLVIHLSDKGLVCKEAMLCKSEVARPQRAVAVGSNKCTWGPGYWCAAESNARECGSGATKHCQEKVWLGAAPSV